MRWTTPTRYLHLPVLIRVDDGMQFTTTDPAPLYEADCGWISIVAAADQGRGAGVWR